MSDTDMLQLGADEVRVSMSMKHYHGVQKMIAETNHQRGKLAALREVVKTLVPDSLGVNEFTYEDLKKIIFQCVYPSGRTPNG